MIKIKKKIRKKKPRKQIKVIPSLSLKLVTQVMRSRLPYERKTKKNH
jgi:predicted nucleic acid binding AN1-type Zn finger protein